MFGIIYGLLGLFKAAGTSIKNNYEDTQSYQRQVSKDKENRVPRNTYFDRHMCERDIHTHQYVKTERLLDTTGDLVQFDIHGRQIRNLSEEERMLDYQEAKENRKPGQTVMLYQKHYWNGNKYIDNVAGRRYKDLTTGDIYVVREFYITQKAPCRFYMNINSKRLVRVADSSLIDFEKYKAKNRMEKIPTDAQIRAFMNEFNFYQGKGGWRRHVYTDGTEASYEEGPREYYNHYIVKNKPEKATEYLACNNFDAFDEPTDDIYI